MSVAGAVKAHPFRVLAVAAAVLIVASVGLWLFDRSHRNEIGPGVKIGGVDVSGLSRAEAERRLEAVLLPRLREPLRVDHADRSWRLGPAEARVTADLPASVGEAIAESRSGSVLERSLRALTGGELDLDLTPSVGYSDEAIVRMIDRVRREVDREPIDATLKMTLSGPKIEPARPGLKVDASALHRRLREAITSATLPRRVSARTAKTQPKVATTEVRKQADTALVVNRERFKLTLYKRLKPVKTYSIAVGATGFQTPIGTYSIQNKSINPAWTKPNSSWVPEDERGEVVPGGTAANPLKARWLGIFDGAGIHGIDPSLYGTIGSAASHGCVRMRIPDVIDLYDRVPVGAPIYIG